MDDPTTVGQLIAALRQFPSNLRVVVPGAEDGFDEITVAQRVDMIVRQRKSSAFHGQHADITETTVVEGDVVTQAVVLRHG